MSEPKRYEHMSDGMGRWFINPRTGKLAPYGEYVMSSDYARLKAENERLRASSFVTAVPVDEYEKLKAEVERLRKAGDAMADAAYAHCMCQDCEELRDQWRAAKEGKQP